jgi:hypothetical protein
LIGLIVRFVVAHGDSSLDQMEMTMPT